MTHEKEDLQIILNEMFASKDDLSLQDVKFWQEKYPNFKREIVEAYAAWREFEVFVLGDENASEIDEKFSETDKKSIGDLLAQFRASPDGETINDLRELAEKQGVAWESLIEKLGASETLMRRFNRRTLKEIPEKIEKKMSEILNVSVESLQAFFSLPASLPKAARYKSKNTPQTQPKQSFAEAVKNDPELTDEEKRKLLESE